MSIQIDGINVHNDKRADLVSNLGCSWVRIDVNWWIIERNKDEFRWGDIDKQVDHYKKNGFKIYATIGYAPSYAVENQTDMPPIDRWQLFVSKFAERYTNKIDVVSIWNEPNLKQFFTGSMSDYFHGLLNTASPIIRKYAPSMKIAAPEIATLSSTKWWKWLRETKHHTELFDIASIHSYADNVIQCFRWGKVPILGWIVPKWGSYNRYLKKINKPVFLTECGYEARVENSKEQKKQIKYIKHVQDNKRKAKIDTIMFYTLRDAVNFEMEGPFGFYTHDWKPKKII